MASGLSLALERGACGRAASRNHGCLQASRGGPSKLSTSGGSKAQWRGMAQAPHLGKCMEFHQISMNVFKFHLQRWLRSLRSCPGGRWAVAEGAKVISPCVGLETDQKNGLCRSFPSRSDVKHCETSMLIYISSKSRKGEAL